MIDSSDRDRVEKARDELNKVIDDMELTNAPILIFANKQDLDGVMNEEELRKRLDLQTLFDNKKKDICYQGCSAKTGDGIWEGISKLGDIIDLNEKNIL